MKQPRAFTLVELLVVVATVGVMIGIALPALSSARHGAKRAVCASHLHQLGLAANMYLDGNNEQYWPYFTDVPGGRLWWFGYEAGGPAVGATNRPLDKNQSVLAPYVTTVSDQFQCPAFPYNDPAFFPKFDQRSASFGYNLRLAGDRRVQYVGRETEVFIFADAVHFDQPGTFNEGHYVLNVPNVAVMSGYGHFRHMGAAQMVMMDGHVQAQRLAGDAHSDLGGALAGNLVADDGSNAIYGD